MHRPGGEAVRTYVVEEQEIYRDLYTIILGKELTTRPIDVLAVSSGKNEDDWLGEVQQLNPDVLLMGVKKLEDVALEALKTARAACPGLGTVVLPVSYERKDATAARKMATWGNGGMALFLKQSLDAAEELCSIVLAVSRGQVVLDPAVAGFLFADIPSYPFLKQLTPRELEVLDLLASGYTNAAIANHTFTDVKTVENHINALYSKLLVEQDVTNKNPRIMAARAYLEATDGASRQRLPAGSTV